MTLTEHSARMPPLDNAGPPAPKLRWPAAMQFRAVPILRKKWQDAALSCSREIDVARRGLRKKAWWPCGPAMEKFDSVIAPEIEALLKHVDLGDADLYLRLYMIGKSPSKSRPVIMVCCSNSHVRAQAEEAIRASEIPEIYSEFALGACALPLEQPGLIRALAGMTDKASTAGRKGSPSHYGKQRGKLPEDEESRVGVTPRNSNPSVAHSTQLVGRRIYARVGGFGDSGPLQPATGGAVIRLGDNLYQLTVSHVIEAAPVSESNLDDPDECHFDGMSEEEEDDDEDEHSMSGEPKVVIPRHASPSPTNAAGSPNIVHSSYFKHDSRDGLNPGLDYALLDLDNDVEDYMSRYPNSIVMRGGGRKTINIGDIAGIPTDEEGVVVVTASRGVTHGVLLPTAVYFRNTTLPGFQKLYPIHLEDCVSLGDSGSVIVGETSGQLFGHLVRGVPLSTTAYIVAATEVFNDIRRRTGLDVQLARAIDLQNAQAAARGRRRNWTGASEDTLQVPEEMRNMAPGMNSLHPTSTGISPYSPIPYVASAPGWNPNSAYPYPLPAPGRDDGWEVRVSPELANVSSDDMDGQWVIVPAASWRPAHIQEMVKIRGRGSTVLKFGNDEIQSQDGAEFDITSVGGNAKVRTPGSDSRPSYIDSYNGQVLVIEHDGRPLNTSSSSVSNPVLEPRNVAEDPDSLTDPFYIKRPRPVQNDDYGTPPSTSPPRPASSSRKKQADRRPRPASSR